MAGTDHTTPGNFEALLELIDAQQHTIERLQQALTTAEQAESDKHTIRRMLAHELRTPLTAVIGALHTLAMPKLPDERRDDLREKALRQALQLNELIDDILSMSDPEGPSVERAAQEWMSVADLVDDVAESVTTALAGHELVLDVAPELLLNTIPSRVRQILVNLLVNAGRYAPEGTTITVMATKADGAVVLEVLDEGAGIDPALVPSLFRPYERGVAGGEGVGLGLYLVRRLTASLGGTVELLNRETGGTLARVRLPQQRMEDAKPPARHLRLVRGTRA